MRGASVVGVLPLVFLRSHLFGRQVVSLPFLNYGGVLASDGQAAAALVARAADEARTFGASHVELRHRTRQTDTLPFRQHKLAFLLPLPADRDSLWKQMDRKVRNQVRKAQKEGLRVIEGGLELVDDFYGVFARNMRDLGTPVYSKRLFIETLMEFPGDAHVFVVRFGDRIVAAALGIRFSDTMLVPWASSLREYRHLCANVLLYWTMIERAVSVGARTFDFGRSSRGTGAHHFKQQWGVREVPMHWEYCLLNGGELPDQGPENPKFRMAVALWQRCPLWLANSIGPRIVRSIP
jgi:FemAB-related protein (PEP-CTERM system-associated)